MSNNYAPCFIRTFFVVIPSYIELPSVNVWIVFMNDMSQINHHLMLNCGSDLCLCDPIIVKCQHNWDHLLPTLNHKKLLILFEIISIYRDLMINFRSQKLTLSCIILKNGQTYFKKSLDPSHEWDPEPKTWDPKGGTWETRLRNQLIGAIWDRDPELLLYIGPDNQGENRDPNKHFLSKQTWDAGTMIQINLIKRPRSRISLIFFLIFNHIIKRLPAFVVNKFFFYCKKLFYVYTNHI